MTYAEKLKDPRWQKKRLSVLDRDEFRCQLCGSVKKTLHVHHFKYAKSRNPWDSPEIDLITLCEGCHETVEELNKQGVFRIASIFKLDPTDRTSDFIIIRQDDTGEYSADIYCLDAKGTPIFYRTFLESWVLPIANKINQLKSNG